MGVLSFFLIGFLILTIAMIGISFLTNQSNNVQEQAGGARIARLNGNQEEGEQSSGGAFSGISSWGRRMVQIVYPSYGGRVLGGPPPPRIPVQVDRLPEVIPAHSVTPDQQVVITPPREQGVCESHYVRLTFTNDIPESKQLVISFEGLNNEEPVKRNYLTSCDNEGTNCYQCVPRNYAPMTLYYKIFEEKEGQIIQKDDSSNKKYTISSFENIKEMKILASQFE